LLIVTSHSALRARHPVLIRCARCGRDAPADSTACPFCPPEEQARPRRRGPLFWGAVAAAVEIAILLAILRC
jgi:hypothetical protein